MEISEKRIKRRRASLGGVGATPLFSPGEEEALANDDEEWHTAYAGQVGYFSAALGACVKLWAGYRRSCALRGSIYDLGIDRTDLHSS